MEETGCTAIIKEEIGEIIEYKDDFEQKQFSYCFLAEVSNNNKKQFFTEEEKAHGFRLEWVDLDKAIKLFENDKPDDYFGKFIVKRDTIFLKKVKEKYR